MNGSNGWSRRVGGRMPWIGQNLLAQGQDPNLYVAPDSVRFADSDQHCAWVIKPGEQSERSDRNHRPLLNGLVCGWFN